MSVDDRAADARTGAEGAARWDRFAWELQALRRVAGEPSFAEIARRVAAARVAGGADEHAARVARTTVYDAFRTGRARVNVPLVREIVRALDGDPAEVDRWLREASPDGRTGRAAEPQPAEAQPGDASARAAAVPEAPAPAARRHVVLLCLACVLVNLAGRQLVDVLGLPAHLDMVGTAVAAFALGPWHGAAVGLTTNLAGVASSGAVSLPFAAVNVLGALLWGWGVRQWGLGRTLPRFLGLNVLVAAACSLVAVPILVLLLDGFAGNGQETIGRTVEAYGAAFVVAVGTSNLLVSIGDKLISGFVALVTVSSLPASLRTGAVLPIAPPGPPDPGTAR